MSHRAHRPSTAPSKARRLLVGLLALSVPVTGALVGITTPANAASVVSAAFSGGAGTFTAANGTVYAKQGAALTLTLNTDGNTRCVDVIDGAGNTIATKS